jgi:hypothetical protein
MASDFPFPSVSKQIIPPLEKVANEEVVSELKSSPVSKTESISSLIQVLGAAASMKKEREEIEIIKDGFTPGIPQKEDIELLGSRFKVPLRGTIRQGSIRNKLILRKIVPEDSITRFDPNSLEFESSINWEDPSFKSTRIEKIESEDGGPNLGGVGLFSMSTSSLSTMLTARLRNFKDIFAYHLIDNTHLKKNKVASERDLEILLGRKNTKRPENFWIVKGKLSISDFKFFISSLVTAWSASAITSNLSTENKFYDTRGDKLIYQLAYDINRCPENYLINVFEVYEDTPSICLSFLSIINQKEGSNTLISHFWISPDPVSIKEYTNLGYDKYYDKNRRVINKIQIGQERMSPYFYVLGGLPRLAWELMVYSTSSKIVSVNEILTPITFEDIDLDADEKSKIHMHVLDYSLIYYWGISYYDHRSFVLPFKYIPETFGLKRISSRGLEIIKNSPLSKIPKFDILRKFILFYNNEQLNRLNPEVNSFSTFCDDISKQIMSIAPIMNEVRSIAMYKKAELISKTKKPLDNPGYFDFVKFASEPEFRENLKV